MSGSIFGTLYKVSTWGESHGAGIGVVVDGCPAGIPLSIEDVQEELDRRKPGTSVFTSQRAESDAVEILSGVFQGKTTGTPISMMILNNDQRSKDYSQIAQVFRPGHADYGYHCKYGVRDYRGGGRSSGRETAGRVAAGAIAKKILSMLGISVTAYTVSIGNVVIDRSKFDLNTAKTNPLVMPDPIAYQQAADLVSQCIEQQDSIGGTVECIVQGLMPGIGEPVFDKLDAMLAHAIFSIGGVKTVEFGDGFATTQMTGSACNDQFFCDHTEGIQKKIQKRTNHAGGVLGGMSDGDNLIFRAGFKPTPSIGQLQETVNEQYENVNIQIKGRHDPLIVPRAIVVVEAMTAIVLTDLVMCNTISQIDFLKKAYERNKIYV